LEEILQAFIQASNQNIPELKSVTMSNDQIMQELKQCRQELQNAAISDNKNIQNLAKMQAHIDYLVAEFNIMEEEKLQSRLMAERHYMIDEDVLAILVMSMSLTAPYRRVRRLWRTMRRKKKRRKLSRLTKLTT
jgi:hypothetical protein